MLDPDKQHYILIGKNPVAVPYHQFLDWGRWFEWNCSNGGRHVGHLLIKPRKPFRKGNASMLRKINRQRAEKIFVSTVFLGLNHNHSFYPTDDQTPVLFETMIFGGKYDDYQTRYYTWDEAAEGHEYAVKIATKGMCL